jgi:hypothetical protein
MFVMKFGLGLGWSARYGLFLIASQMINFTYFTRCGEKHRDVFSLVNLWGLFGGPKPGIYLVWAKSIALAISV